MIKNRTFTIVLPCYNPILGWEKTVINAINELQQKLEINIDLVIVNDGSTQNVTAKEIDHLKSAIPQLHFVSYGENRGKGFALREGVSHVKNFPIVYTDIDFPYTTESFISIYKEVISGEFDTV